MIALVDYGAGNVESVAKAIRHLGREVVLTDDAKVIGSAEGVILPGVGAFGDAVAQLRARGLEQVVKESAADPNRPFLGICVGLQMLFDSSEESPGAAGLSLMSGKVLRLPSDGGLKVPHIGWNSIEYDRDCPIFARLPERPYVYFVHSYYLRADDTSLVAATAEYGTTIHAAVWQDSCFATQFHPEKSGEIGLTILDNFCSLI